MIWSLSDRKSSQFGYLLHCKKTDCYHNSVTVPVESSADLAGHLLQVYRGFEPQEKSPDVAQNRRYSGFLQGF